LASAISGYAEEVDARCRSGNGLRTARARRGDRINVVDTIGWHFDGKTTNRAAVVTVITAAVAARHCEE
jgi:hypothetical protein